MALIIQDAKKIQQFARVCLWGVEKMGKTHAALELAHALVPGGKIGVISSERGSSASMAKRFPHKIINLSMDEGYKPANNPFSPKRYEEALDLFVAERCDVIIVDSGSHIWEGEGGILELVASKSNTFDDGWKAGSPLYQRFLGHMLNVPCHLIVTLRAKDAYEMEEYTNKKGERKIGPKNVGSAPVIRKYFGYEMQFMIRMDEFVGRIMSSAYQEELPKGTEIESMSQEFAPALLRFLDGLPMPERVPTLLESCKRGIATGAWTKETFATIASKGLGLTLTRSTQLNAEQLQQFAALAEAGAPVESRDKQTGQPESPASQVPTQPATLAQVTESEPEKQDKPVKVVERKPQAQATGEANQPTTEAQLASIRRLYERLGKEEPESTRSLKYLEAKELIAQLSQEYKASRTQAPATEPASALVPTLNALITMADKDYPGQFPALRAYLSKEMGFSQNAQRWTEPQRAQAHGVIKQAATKAS